MLRIYNNDHLSTFKHNYWNSTFFSFGRYETASQERKHISRTRDSEEIFFWSAILKTSRGQILRQTAVVAAVATAVAAAVAAVVVPEVSSFSKEKLFLWLILCARRSERVER